MGVENTFQMTPLGVLFSNSPGQEIPDPYFGGIGPKRNSCTLCGACMTGCRLNAKNTLVKNYLYLAEKLGVEIISEFTVENLEQANNSAWKISGSKSSAWFGQSKTFHAEQVPMVRKSYFTR
jgi:cholesterol oxidase